jgi:carboxypeptidase PM20D1
MQGYTDWDIHVSGEAGHASLPPTGAGTSVAARLAKLVARLEQQQTPTRLQAPVTDFLAALAPAARSAPWRAALAAAAAPWLRTAAGQALGLYGGRTLAAMVRSTVAVVAVEAGGGARNVLPANGTLALNIRLLPGDDESFVREYLSGLVVTPAAAAWARAAPAGGHAAPASPVSPASGPHWDLIRRAAEETLSPPGGPALLVAPYLLTGLTDSRHYAALAPERVFRFAPFRTRHAERDLARVHGVDERIRAADWLDGVRFYARFLELAAAS